MKFVNNLNIQELEMSIEQLVSQSLLQPITNQILQSLFESETIIQTIVKLQPQAQKSFKLKLKDQYILLHQNSQYECEATYFIRLDLEIRFQKILTILDLSKKVNSNLNKHLKGFKLVHQNGEQVSFYIQFADLTNIWVKCLSKHINQLGFHNYFKPIRKLGKGAFASVYEIIKLQNGQRLAAKIFCKQILKNSPAKFYSFKNQIEILRNLEHKNLLAFEGVFETDKSLYLIVQVLNGGNLFQFLMSRKTHLSIEETKTIMRNLMQGLAELQSLQVVHRDIKLQNIMLRQKDTLQPIIVDFGLAAYSWEDQYPMKTGGTPGYLSPEVVNSEKGANITSKSDVFSAGVVFHVLLMGRYLFDGKDAQTVFQNNKKMNINLLKPEYINIDKNAYDLLCKMLIVNSQQRISASQCLQHPFLRIDAAEKMEVSPASTNQDYHF